LDEVSAGSGSATLLGLERKRPRLQPYSKSFAAIASEMQAKRDETMKR